MIRTQPVASAILLAAVFAVKTFAGDETCGVCDKTILVSGQFSHWRADDNLAIQGAARAGAAAFREEISGTNFTVAVLHLPAGRYTLQIGMAENYFTNAGERVFDITCDDDVIAGNLDIFAAAGGAARVLFLTNVVDFPGDALRGPLNVNFTARTNAAKLNTLEIRDAAGNSVIFLRAADLVSAEDAAARKIPVVNGPEIWKDAAQPVAARVPDLVRRLSLAENISEMCNSAAAIPRLGMGLVNTVMAELTNLAEVVSAAACRAIPQGQPIVGETAFTHESGIHVSGLLRDPATYEALDPALFGRERRILLGKHSGSASLRDALAGMNVAPVALPDLLARLRSHAERVKRSVTRDELVSLMAVAAE